MLAAARCCVQPFLLPELLAQVSSRLPQPTGRRQSTATKCCPMKMQQTLLRRLDFSHPRMFSACICEGRHWKWAFALSSGLCSAEDVLLELTRAGKAGRSCISMELRLPATVSLVVGCTIVKEDLFSFLKLLRDPCLGEARDRMAKV